MKDLIKKLVEAFGPSGYEDQVRAIIQAEAAGKADEIRTDNLGNLIVLKKGSGGGERIMISAHMDEIGLMVSYIDKKGFARIGNIGGIALATLTGSRARFADGTIAVLYNEKDGWMGPGTLAECFIDTGATSPEDSPVKVGDVACIHRPFEELGGRLVSKAMDDRIGCAVALQALLDMAESPNDVYFVFSTQEEVGCRGAMVAAFGIEPEVAVAVDVTLTGDIPLAKPMSVELGKGPAVKVKDAGMLAHPGVKKWMVATAEKLALPYQLEVLTGGTTDAYTIQTSRDGIAAGCLSIPTRYVHSPSEMVDYNDVLNSVKLLVGMLSAPVSW
ncbi:MAG: M42 family metallopeptidase [Chloroflexi bacterium]|nr:M42 family metallopeptidase [Chloroflexota bacterium]